MGFFDDLLGNTASDAANAAAADTYAKQQKAIQGLTSYGDTLPGAFNALGQHFQPYAQGGQAGLEQLLAGLGLGPAGSQQAFTDAYRALPGYQSGLDRGVKAATGQFNSRHGDPLMSGAGMKALYRYGSDYEDQRSGDYLSRLMGLAGMGQQAAGAQAGLGAQGLQGQLATRQSAFGGGMNAAGTIGQGMVAGAQAKQDALGNLLNSATYLGGAALGGGFNPMKSFAPKFGWGG